ncbi:Dyp-type peroxidase [Rhodobacteraceae bacterium RKSG542]|uniref:Dyp-type peroxidase n=1 Tax=Pseudovibrio flavus TaxID=2529854 RepID=UPI0012BD2312|nr:Dyp-type peroxidase [Pseudovibrio flavus]MTI16506.1 Dyp-type peroxidase [Pseudovibrio flavus]
MNNYQTGILADLPLFACYLHFGLQEGCSNEQALEVLSSLYVNETIVIGVGPALLGEKAESLGLKPFTTLTGVRGVEAPETQDELWVWVRGADREEVETRSKTVTGELSEAFVLLNATDAFLYKGGRDLSGYEDGTENPIGEEAVEAAIVAEGSANQRGGSLVAVQKWIHDLEYFNSLPVPERDDVIGRRLEDNYEFPESPISSHVKRTGQNSFEKPAFVVRRSMPFMDDDGKGLMFVAYGASLWPFEVQMKRMLGLDDGIVDGLFRFSRPITGAYYWCPPVTSEGRLNLKAA